MTAILQRLRLARKPVETSTKPATAEDEEVRYKPISWSLIRRLLSAMRPYRRQYALGISLTFIHVMLDMLGPQFIGAFVNYCAAFTIDSTERARTFFDRALIAVAGEPAINGTTFEKMFPLGLLLGLWALTIVLSIGFQRQCILVITRAGESVQFDFRRRVFAHLQALSMSYYDKTKLGRIISRCTSDISGMREVNVWGVTHIVVHASIILIAIAAMVLTDWRIFLAVIWLAPFIYYLNWAFIRKAGRQSQVVREGFTRVSSNIAENISGMRVVTAFNRQEPNLATFNRLQDANTDNNMRSQRIAAVFHPTLESTRFVGRFMILIVGGYLVATEPAGKSVGAVVTCYFYWDWLMNSILFLGQFYNQLMMAMAGAERVFSLLDLKPEVVDSADAVSMPPIRGRVEFRDVVFGYDPKRPVLHGINFSCEPGQTVALVGHTGSGKSSIISLIARFYQPQEGEVRVDGINIRHVTGESLHRQMGLVLQVNYLFSGTVMDNIKYVKPDATDEQVMKAARDLGSYDAIMTLKNGFQTDVGERGANMSLGQRQLICFTRAFLADPRIFMLDEATSAIDTHTEQIIQASLERLTHGRTTFIVAHRLSTIMKADLILVIDQGRIVERGRHNELLDLGGKYAALYEQFAHVVPH
jgi:ATP-binding cassette subfamily B protein